MINHSALEDRLTAVGNGEKIPDPPLPPKPKAQKQEVPKNNYITYKQFFISEGYKTFNVLVTSMLYGFGLNAIFSTDWGFAGILGTGFLLNHFLTLSLKLFKRK